uniref:AlNc14C99G5986 protein n=1 Tax=Albugo laibachii Nc14 TaxID=890382 RepID=F0WHC2_9STRA|nr:AlNc14C99G5986 [Albugo laibachii Nc14]|eukprot:CCA20640.1 AlNc14C99G5986 [Albugo laibachii Nc14]
MDLGDFLCFADEVDKGMEASTTADLLSVDGIVAFLSTAQDNSDDDEPAESGTTCEGVCSAHPAISIEGKLAAIRAVIFMLGDHPDLEKRLMGDLRMLQQRLREELRVEKENALTQTSIRSYFSAASTMQ